MLHMKGHLPEAYSRLGFILALENGSVLGLQRKLEAVGVSVNVKSLYRLADAAPLQKIDLRIVAGICKVFGIALDDLITFEKPKAQLQHLDAKSQARLDALMSKNNEGPITAGERKEFLALADQAHRISMENTRILIAERRRVRNDAEALKKQARPKRPPVKKAQKPRSNRRPQR
jgi:DNA-binding Xre family transcriptional regulator